MKHSLIISVVGPDRPGLIQDLSEVVTRAGGNWEGSRLMQLGGQFAGMVQVIIADEQLNQLKEALGAVESKGLSVFVIHSENQTPEFSESGRLLTFEIVGQDRSGIVASISETLAKLGVNVIELGTECQQAAMSGETHFFTVATVSLPDHLSEDDLRQAIEGISDDLMVEFVG